MVGLRSVRKPEAPHCGRRPTAESRDSSPGTDSSPWKACCFMPAASIRSGSLPARREACSGSGKHWAISAARTKKSPGSSGPHSGSGGADGRRLQECHLPAWLGEVSPFGPSPSRLYWTNSQPTAAYRVTPIILVPAATGPAPEGLASTGDSRVNRPWTALGTPSISVPMQVRKKLPLGLQLTAAPGQDSRLLYTAVRIAALLDSPA